MFVKSKQNTNSREILDSNDDKLLLQNGIQRRRKTEANNLESLSTGPEAGVWSLVTNKKSERKMKNMILSLIELTAFQRFLFQKTGKYV